ncbi:NACHT and WD repeat domain-containing protein 2-like [Tubulanus polymorphus]|uniref:NACHT and WD repeat domain-containing protein 2-like n=1 Tax=Tubulanus polymorphus TaxID=672921 RepID=UPI003DA39E83
MPSGDTGPLDVLRGQRPLEDLPILHSKIVRVFLSSTFTDTRAERNAAMQNVFPVVKKYCRDKYGFEFQVVDMRWGIPAKASENHTTTELCLKQIQECQRLSAGPNFVLMLGEKYGSRMLPYRIPADEFESITLCIQDNDMSVDLLNKWYKKDENSLPPEFLLQPVKSVLGEKSPKEWWYKDESRMRTVFTDTVKQCVEQKLMSQQTSRKYTCSVTENELHEGITKVKDNVAGTVICFTRRITDLERYLHIDKIKKYVDWDQSKGEIDADAKRRVRNLKERVIPHSIPPSNVISNMVTWAGNVGMRAQTEYLNDFCSQFTEKLIQLIDKGVKSAGQGHLSALMEDIVKHQIQCKERSDNFHARKDELNKLAQYVRSDHRYPLVVHGQTGIGKTSFTSKAFRLTSSWLSKNAAICIRLIGTTLQSSNINLLLQTLCEQFNAIGFDTKPVPKTYRQLRDRFINILSADHRFPLVLYLDALNQLSPGNNAHRLDWLPSSLGKNVKVIVTTLSDDDSHMMQRLKEKIRDTSTFIELSPLSHIKCTDILKLWLREHNRQLTSHQVYVVGCAFMKCSVPLFLKLVFDEVYDWNSYTKVHMSDTLAATVPDSIGKLLDRLESRHDGHVVKHALAYITASRNGLSDSEVEDLLSLDDDVLNSIYTYWLPPIRRIPPSLWTRIRSDIDTYLVEREANGVLAVYWYHQEFINVTSQRYLADKNFRRLVHSNIADYLLGVWSDGREKPFTYSDNHVIRFELQSQEGVADRKVSSQPLRFSDGENSTSVRFNFRKLNMLPYHLNESGRVEELEDEVLFNYEFLYSKLRATSLHNILTDFQLHVTDETKLLADTLQLAESTINRDPEKMCVEIIGRLLKYCPLYPKILRLVEACYLAAGKQCALVPAYQCYQAPGGPLQHVFEPHINPSNEVDVNCIHTTADTEYIILKIPHESTIRRWNVDSGEPQQDLRTAMGYVYNTSFLTYNIYVVTTDDTICVYDAEIGNFIVSVNLRQYGGDVTHLDISRDQIALVVQGITSKGPIIIEAHSGKLRHRFQYEAKICALSDDGDIMVCNSGTLILYHNLDNYKIIKTFKVPDEVRPPCSIIIRQSDKDAIVIYTSKHRTTIYRCRYQYTDREKVSFVAELECRVNMARMAPKDESYVLLSTGTELRVVDVVSKDGSRVYNSLPKLIDPQSKYLSADFNFNETLIVALRDGFLLAWRVIDCSLVWSLKPSFAPMQQIHASRLYNKIVSVSSDNCLQVWNLDKISDEMDSRLHVLNVPITDIMVGDATGTAVACSEDELRRQRVPLDLKTGTPNLKHIVGEQAVSMSPDGNFLVTNSLGEGLHLWDLSRDQIVYSAKLTCRREQVIFSDDGSRIVLISKASNTNSAASITAHVLELYPEPNRVKSVTLGCMELISEPFLTNTDYLVLETLSRGDTPNVYAFDIGVNGDQHLPLCKQDVADFDENATIFGEKILKAKPLGVDTELVLVVFAKISSRLKFVDGAIEPNLRAPKTAFIWNPSRDAVIKKCRRFMKVNSDVNDLRISSNGKFIVDRELNIYDVWRDEIVHKIDYRGAVGLPIIAKDKFVLFIATGGLTVQALRLTDYQTVAEIDVHGRATCIVMAQDEQTILIGSEDGRVMAFTLVDSQQNGWQSRLRRLPSLQQQQSTNHSQDERDVTVTLTPPATVVEMLSSVKPAAAAAVSDQQDRRVVGLKSVGRLSSVVMGKRGSQACLIQ